MAEYSKLVITQSGRALIAKIISGSGDITFTKVCSSGATYTEGELESLTELKEIKQTCLVSNVSRTNDVAIKIEAAFSNAELTEGYDMRTLGLYAVDPDEGEILYAVCIETAGSSYMPPCNGVTVSAAYIQLYVAVGNTDNVSLDVNPEAFATIGDIRTIEQGMSALSAALGGKVDKAEGKGLSENDYTTAEKDKLAGIATGTCTTPQGTAAKTVDCPDFELRDGARVMVTFNNGNTSNYMKLNVNGTGEYFAYFPIDGFRAYNNEAISKLIVAGCAYEFIFQEDGSNSKWVYCGVVSTAESLGALSKKDLSNHLGGPGIPIIQSATDSGGLMEIGKYIDFHDAGSQADFDVRLYCDQGKLVSTAPIQAPGGTVSGNITGSGGGAFAIDGNVYIKSQGYDGWLTNYLGQYFPKTGGTLSGDLVFQGRGKKLHFGDDNSSCPYMMCNDGSDSDLEIYAPSGYVSVNDNLSAKKNSYFNGDVHFENQQKNISLKLGPNVAIDFAGTGFETSSASIGGGYPVFYGHGCIFGDNIDEGIMEYVARGHYYDHCFCSINENGKNLRTVTLSDGNVSCDTVNGKSADYAENWEWADGNPNSEDRVGLFVTFQGPMIRISKKGDPLVKVGVISGSPCIIGDADDGREWKQKYLKDVYGRLMRDEEGGQIINPAYDPDQAYISRSNRPEWDAVGTHGKLVVRDDGTCQPDGFCVPTDGGIATAAEDGFYVMERLDESHIRIYMR